MTDSEVPPPGRLQISRRRVLQAGGVLLAAPCMAAVDDPGVGFGLSDLLDGSAMMPIRAGSFAMGFRDGLPDQRPVHKVRIARAFEIGKCEITQAQWETVMSGAHRAPEEPLVTPGGVVVAPNPSHFKGEVLPVESVSWNDIQLFLLRLNRRDTRFTYRLPTEAEWEYCRRAGTGEETPASLENMAWLKDNSGGETQPVGRKTPNPWGLFDMEGNVSEWVEDWFARDYYANSPATDPQGPRTGSYRVYRGACWFDTTKYCQAAFRRFDFPDSRVYNVGFRVVRTRK